MCYPTPMRILFITRKFPPQIGGMEKFSADFYQLFKSQCTLLALHGKQINLVWWLPYAFIRGLWLARQVEVIHLGDGLLAGLGVLLHWLTRKPISITVHGLDVTYQKFGYQNYIWRALKKYNAIICVSEATQKIVLQHHIPADRVSVIAHGINVNDWQGERSREILGTLLSQVDFINKTILLSVGRLVERKGVNWFVREVMPKLAERFVYLITSTGPELQKIKTSIRELKLEQKVFLLGEVNNTTLRQLYLSADWFVMPNIGVENDMEGFGLVALEASASGTPVLAANLEGVRSAVVDGRTGFLVESGDAEVWKRTLESQITLINTDVTDAVRGEFSLEQVKQNYLIVFNKLL